MADIWEFKKGTLRWDGGTLTGDLSADDYSMLIPVIGERVSLHLVIASGDADGVFKFQETNSPAETPVTMALPVVTKSAAAALNEMAVIDGVASKYIRVWWDRTSGGSAQTVEAHVYQAG